jgi:hypothetical protein
MKNLIWKYILIPLIEKYCGIDVFPHEEVERGITIVNRQVENTNQGLALRPTLYEDPQTRAVNWMLESHFPEHFKRGSKGELTMINKKKHDTGHLRVHRKR